MLSKAECVRLRQVEHVNSEREILASVRHPFIVDMFLTFQTPSNLFMCLEYMVGGELFSHLRREGRFVPDVAKFYAASIVLALEYLHENDIIYRDLKPEVAQPKKYVTNNRICSSITKGTLKSLTLDSLNDVPIEHGQSVEHQNTSLQKLSDPMVMARQLIGGRWEF
jgi:hypothetical protein